MHDAIKILALGPWGNNITLSYTKRGDVYALSIYREVTVGYQLARSWDCGSEACSENHVIKAAFQ
tara:strand:+ start:328 stop:522 length:195 start_codon:yes stop_codon:yes gene_type:complete